ncbi:GTP-binding protein YPT32/YPT11 [Pelomyxa schiedti]|nr:GTP-binding protein YPT32/YPT11 [Pelomyxa schiedti]
MGNGGCGRTSAAAPPRPLITSRSPQDSIRIVMLGPSGGGKSSLLHRLTQNSFTTATPVTVANSFELTDFQIDGVNRKLSIWDTAGQERYHSLVPSYFRGAHGVMLVYDTTEKESFDQAKDWYKMMKEHAPKRIVPMIVANKTDLNRDGTSDEEVNVFLQKEGILLFKRCSALTGDNVSLAFTELCRRVLSVHSSLGLV